MQLSPQLLRSIAVGIGISTALVSCGVAKVDAEPIDHAEKCTQDACVDDCKKAAATIPSWDNCPACGMG